MPVMPLRLSERRWIGERSCLASRHSFSVSVFSTSASCHANCIGQSGSLERQLSPRRLSLFDPFAPSFSPSSSGILILHFCRLVRVPLMSASSSRNGTSYTVDKRIPTWPRFRSDIAVVVFGSLSAHLQSPRQSEVRLRRVASPRIP